MKQNRTYKIEKPPEIAISWAEYNKNIIIEWEALLNKTPKATEPEIQTFLEKHPCMIPGAGGLLGNPSGHCPSLGGVISQAPLPSYDKRIPDFMWLTKNSDTVQPVLIEIEEPSKHWFTRSGQPTAEFTHALTQIVEWKAWFARTHNLEAFKAFYGLDREVSHRPRFKPVYILIFGRRAEVSDPILIAKKAHLFPDDVFGMTYDRLTPNSGADQLVCIKSRHANSFEVISVPGTLKWTPVLAGERAYIKYGWADAINSNAYISESRKKFLIDRQPYWQDWGSSKSQGTINSSDEE